MSPDLLEHITPTIVVNSADSVQSDHSQVQVGLETTQALARPLLLLFASRRSGGARRAEAFIGHILQRRHNHDSFDFRIIDESERPDLFERFRIEEVPTVLIVEDRRIRRRLTGRITPSSLEQAMRRWLH